MIFGKSTVPSVFITAIIVILLQQIRKWEVSGPQLGFNETFRKIHEIYCQISEFQPSFGSLTKLKPFKNEIKITDLPHSLTECLCIKFNCQRNKTVNYYNKDCIEEKCKNKAKRLS